MRHLNVIVCLLCAALLLDGALAESPQRDNINAGQAFNAADEELTALYEELLDTLDKDGRAALVASQQAWVAYRDAESAFKSLPHKGTARYAMEYTRAMTTETRERSAELREHLQQAGT